MARNRSLDDLLGTEKPEVLETDWSKLHKGVSLNWLGGFLGMDRKTLKKRLGECPAISVRNGNELYDPKLALSYLIKPRFDVGAYIRTMNPSELPPMLRKEFWDAETKKLNWQERSGELWTAENVLEVASDAYTRAKNIIQIWPDDLQRQVGLTDVQYKELIKRCDALRDDLYRSFVAMMAERKTTAVRYDMEGEDDGDPTPT